MSYQSYATTEMKDAVESDRLKDAKVGADNDIKDRSQHNSDSSTQQTAESFSTPSQTSPSQSSSLAASSKPASLEDRDVKENLHKGISHYKCLSSL